MENRSHQADLALSSLIRSYLGDQADIASQSGALPVDSEVAPYEAIPTQAIDMRLAWQEASAVFRFYPNAPAPRTIIPGWAQLVAMQSNRTGLPFAAGHYPQQVRDLALLFSVEDLQELPRPEYAVSECEASSKWIHKTMQRGTLAERFLAAGVQRLAHQYTESEASLRQIEAQLPETWKTAWQNEWAAGLWMRGDREAAESIWRGLDQSAPVLFNLGMATLFLGRKTEARATLTSAAQLLPESCGWHHLGQLYLALASE